MLIISSGMQKSGSAYFYNVINELLVASGKGLDAREVKHNRNLEGLMKSHNNAIGKPTLFKLMRLWRISTHESTFAIKTHEAPNLSVRMMSKLGMVRIIYCYRDPRDVLLSAIDHGKKILDSRENHTFAKMADFDSALKNVKSWLRTWEAYDKMPGVITVKYEKMMQDPISTTKEIEDFLNISIDPEKRQSILWSFSKDNVDANRKGLHFNKAYPFRYKTEMSEEQKAKCKDAFGNYLLAMGYDSK